MGEQGNTIPTRSASSSAPSKAPTASRTTWPAARDAAGHQGQGPQARRRSAAFQPALRGAGRRRTQTLHIHLEEYAPGGKTQKHGHVNEAAFYILDGAGYEIHDGIRYDWKAGDVAIVHNNCVHQHFNAEPKEPARALVIKTKPMYMFMNMLFQATVEKRTKKPSPTQGNFVPAGQGEEFQPRRIIRPRSIIASRRQARVLWARVLLLALLAFPIVVPAKAGTQRFFHLL